MAEADAPIGFPRRRTIGLALGLAGLNLACWGLAFVCFRSHPLLLGTALTAWSLGLRHAVDADHIAAIDNVTRKFMQKGKRPVSIGLFFALGHSTVVIGLSAAIAVAASALENRFDAFRSIGGVVGTLISAFFLFAIALVNLVVLAGLWRSFRNFQASGQLAEAEIDQLLSGRGLMSRLCRRLFGLIEQGWHMYPLGFLFGLGFDTATEVALLGISASSAAQGMPFWTILIFPALFSAGMALIDSADGVLMLGAYGFAFIRPAGKLRYNISVTLISVLAALLVGGIEVAGLVVDQFGLEGAIPSALSALNDDFGLLGILLIALFALSWLVSLSLGRLKQKSGIEAAP